MDKPQPPAPVASRRWFDLRHPLPPQDAQHRITAYIYGNLVVLAALIPINSHEVSSKDVVTVLGITVTTFLVHVFADVVISTWSKDNIRRAAQDSVPILTSGVLPALLVSAALLGAPTLVALLLAEILLVLRLASLGVVMARLQSRPPSAGPVWSGIGLAAVALGIVLIQAALPQ